MADIFDKNAKFYSGSIDEALGRYGTSHDFFTAHKAWLIKDLLHEQGRDPSRLHVLDVGCGVGKIHEHLAADFAAIAGVDVSGASLEVARDAFPGIDYKLYDGHRLPYDAESFDLSIAICVFHHVHPSQWEELAGEMLRVLRPGGMSLVIEHNPYNPITRRVVNNCPLDADAFLLRPKILKKAFLASRGRDIRHRTIVNIPPANPVLRKLDRWLGFMPLGAQYYLTASK